MFQEKLHNNMVYLPCATALYEYDISVIDVSYLKILYVNSVLLSAMLNNKNNNYE